MQYENSRFPTPAGKGSKVALLLTTILSGGLISPAFGQGVPAATNISVDANSIDVVDGSLNISSDDVSVGPSDDQKGGLSFSKLYGVSGWTHSKRYFIDKRVEGGQTFAYVTMGNLAVKFLQSGSTYSPVGMSGTTLTSSVAGAVTTYIFTGRDGTVVTLLENSAGSSLGIRVDSVKYPLGDIDQYYYKTVLFNGIRYERLQSVKNNTGWQLKFTYGTNTLATGTESEWQRITSARAINNTIDYCDPIADSCSYSTTWPEAQYGQSAVPGGTALTTTNPVGSLWTYTQNSQGKVIGIRKPSSSVDDVTIAYDANGRVSSVNSGGNWTYSYSDVGTERTTTITSPLSTVEVYKSNLTIQRVTSKTDQLGNVTQYQYDTAGRLLRIIYPEGNRRDFVYDARGNVTSDTSTPKAGSPLSPTIITASFDASCGNPLKCNKPNSTVDARGNSTSLLYHAASGQLSKITRPPAVSGAAQIKEILSYASQRAKYKDSSGLIVDSPTTVYRNISVCTTLLANCIDSGEKTSFSFVATSNLLPGSIVESSANGSLSVATERGYDAFGNLVSVDGPLAGTSDLTRYRVNMARQIIGVVDPDPDGAGARIHRAQRLTYNADGLVSASEVGTVNGQTDSDWAAFSSQQQLTTHYDSLGRKLSDVTTAGGLTFGVTQYSYDGIGRLECTAVRMNPAVWGSLPSSACTPQTTGISGPDRISKVIYDSANRVSKVQEAFGTADQSDSISIAYTANGKQATVTDGEGNLTDYSYDGLDRLITTRFPSLTVKGSVNPADYESLTYDANGNVVQRRLRDGQLHNLSYDNLNRLSTKDLPGAELDVTYTYDLQDRMTSATQTGNVVTFTYDELGRNLTQVGPQGTLSYQYDGAGRQIRTTWPDSFYVTYDYDVAGNITAIRENGAASGVGVLATYAYDNLGNRTTLTRGNGAITNYAFDGVSRWSSLTHDSSGTAQDLTLGFGYSPSSQIADNTRSNDAYAWTGHYNVNRPYTVNGLNQLTTAGAVNLGYDGRGNLVSSGANAYAYSSENRLLSGPGGAVLTYDPLGRLYQTVGGGVTTRFGYDGNALVGEYSAANATLRRYVIDPESGEPVVWYEGSGTADRRWLHTDERGSVIATSNASGTVTSIYTYDEYGIPSPANVGRYQYTGQVWLPELGMYYYKARIYSPTLGRFMQTDPVGYSDGLNLYAYVGGDPINQIDPTGMRKAPANPTSPAPGVDPDIVVNGYLLFAFEVDGINLVRSKEYLTFPRGDPAKQKLRKAQRRARQKGRPWRGSCDRALQEPGKIEATADQVTATLLLGWSVTSGEWRNIKTGTWGTYKSFTFNAGLDVGISMGIIRANRLSDFAGLGQGWSAGFSIRKLGFSYGRTYDLNNRRTGTTGGIGAGGIGRVGASSSWGETSLGKDCNYAY